MALTNPVRACMVKKYTAGTPNERMIMTTETTGIDTDEDEDEKWVTNNYVYFQAHPSTATEITEVSLWVGSTDDLESNPKNVVNPGMVNLEIHHWINDNPRMVNLDIDVDDAERIALLLLMQVKENRERSGK